MKTSALIIGEFTTTEFGYTGAIATLAVKISCFPQATAGRRNRARSVIPPYDESVGLGFTDHAGGGPNSRPANAADLVMSFAGSRGLMSPSRSRLVSSHLNTFTYSNVQRML